VMADKVDDEDKRQGGNPEMGDLNPVLERIVALRQTIIVDGIAHGVPFHPNDIQTIVERLKSEGSSFVKVTLPLLGKALDIGLVCGTFTCPAHFRLRKDARLPVFTGRVFCTIFDDEGRIRSQPNVVSIFFLRQLLSLDGKLLSSFTPLQEKEAVDGFRSRQANLLKRRLPLEHPVLLEAKRLLTWTLKKCDLSVIDPGHGPGSVAEGHDKFRRWDFDSWPSRAERWYPFHEYGSQSFVALCATGAPRMLKNSVTKCCLVPKDYKGPRLISAESAATQYLQQGQMRALMSFIDNHWLLSRSIRLRDQTHNQTRCKEAYDKGSVTLDLSNASDTVSAPLVWFLLSGVPRLRSQLFCTRSQFMKVNKELVRITAFSPMGSAVCFPVETLVFWAISMASVHFVHSSWYPGQKSRIPPVSEIASEIAVFGDDIIIPGYAFSTVSGTLESVGCEVNKSKTCYQTPFRESCGSEWYNHTDVTIIRNRRYNYDANKNISDYPVLLDLQRKFFLWGLENTAALLSQWGREIGPIVTISAGSFRRGLIRRARGHFVSEHDGYCQSFVASHGHIFPELRSSGKCDFEYSKAGHDGNCFTAFPSGLDLLYRNDLALDTLCCALGWYTSLDRGVRIRYNRDYQRFECRLPRVFQDSRQWDTNEGTDDPTEGHSHDLHGMGHRAIAERRALFGSHLKSSYARLLARVVGDTIERIAIRYRERYKMAWSELPVSPTFMGENE
jgi:hypothetical protein